MAGVDAHVAESLGYARWHKLVWNVPFNGMCVVLNSNTDRLLENESIRELSHEMMQEVVEAAQKCGYNLDNDLPHKMINMTMKMEPYAPSMKLDFDNKRTLEVEAIYSAPVKAAQKSRLQNEKSSHAGTTAKIYQRAAFIRRKATSSFTPLIR